MLISVTQLSTLCQHMFSWLSYKTRAISQFFSFIDDFVNVLLKFHDIIHTSINVHTFFTRSHFVCVTKKNVHTFLCLMVQMEYTLYASFSIVDYFIKKEVIFIWF